jgi:hypothetical protein
LKRNEKWVRLLRKLLYLKAAMHGGNKKSTNTSTVKTNTQKRPEKTINLHSELIVKGLPLCDMRRLRK